MGGASAYAAQTASSTTRGPEASWEMHCTLRIWEPPPQVTEQVFHSPVLQLRGREDKKQVRVCLVEADKLLNRSEGRISLQNQKTNPHFLVWRLQSEFF